MSPSLFLFFLSYSFVFFFPTATLYTCRSFSFANHLRLFSLLCPLFFYSLYFLYSLPISLTLFHTLTSPSAITFPSSLPFPFPFPLLPFFSIPLHSFSFLFVVCLSRFLRIYPSRFSLSSSHYCTFPLIPSISVTASHLNDIPFSLYSPFTLFFTPSFPLPLLESSPSLF